MFLREAVNISLSLAKPFSPTILIITFFRVSLIGDYVYFPESHINNYNISRNFNKEYKETMKIDDAIKLCVKSLKKVLDANFNSDRVDAVYITTEEKKFRVVDRMKIKELLKG